MIHWDQYGAIKNTICQCHNWSMRGAVRLATMQSGGKEANHEEGAKTMDSTTIVNERGELVIPDPPLATTLFATTRFSWLWFILRLYLGWQWLSSGWGKISGGTWASGESLKGFWTNAVAVPEQGRPPIAFDWYRDFI